MINHSDPFYETKLNKLQLMLYLVPIVGWVLSIWTLYHRQGTTAQKSVSRISVTLTLSWAIAYILLWTSSSFTLPIYTLRLLYLNGLLTSGYFLASLGLILRLWKRK